jgi:hypothetical protein
MDLQVIRTITRTDGQRRVDIFRRADGLYGFAEMAHYQNPLGGGSWAPLLSYATVVDSPDAAEREARASIPWLIEISN